MIFLKKSVANAKEMCYNHSVIFQNGICDTCVLNDNLVYLLA